MPPSTPPFELNESDPLGLSNVTFDDQLKLLEYGLNKIYTLLNNKYKHLYKLYPKYKSVSPTSVYVSVSFYSTDRDNTLIFQSILKVSLLSPTSYLFMIMVFDNITGTKNEYMPVVYASYKHKDTTLESALNAWYECYETYSQQLSKAPW